MSLPAWYVFPKPPFSRYMKLVIAIFFLFVLSLVIYGSFRRDTPLPTKAFSVNGRVFMVEVADTQSARKQGLSDRSTLAPDRGMLFVFNQPVREAFWMPRMHFPLDILFLRQGLVVDLVKNLPAPKAGEIPAVYQPSAEYDQALELNAGTIDRLQLDREPGPKLESSGTVPNVSPAN